jgi:hypothetical protein
MTQQVMAKLRETTVAKTFNVGYHVSWNSEAGRVTGTIMRVNSKNVKYKSYTHHATKDDPEYEIKSDKTDHIALHKGSALRASACLNTACPRESNMSLSDLVGNAVLSTSSDAIIAAHHDGIIGFRNSGAERIFGFTGGEAIGRSLDLINPERLRQRHWDGHRRTMKTGESRYGTGFTQGWRDNLG